MKPYLVWRGSGYSEVKSINELDELVDELHVEAKTEAPFSLQVCVDPDSCLLITLGREECHLEYYSSTQRPLAVGCLGPWDSDELVTYDHGRQESEVPMRYCVPIADARAALRQYFQTGLRPTNIQWNEVVV